ACRRSISRTCGEWPKKSHPSCGKPPRGERRRARALGPVGPRRPLVRPRRLRLVAARFRRRDRRRRPARPTGRPGRDGVGTRPAAGFASLEFSGLPPDLYPALRKLVRAPTLEIVSVGNIALNHDFTEVARQDLGRVELVILPVVALLLLLVFGGVVAAALPLVVGGLAMAGAMAGTLLLARFVSVSIYAPDIVSMIGLGVAGDYSLFWPRA